MARPRMALLLVGAAALLGACGDDETSGDEEAGLTEAEQEYADAIALSIRDEEDGFDLETAEAQCMGEAVMVELGVEPFEESDVKPEDIDPSSSPGELLGDGTVSTERALTIVDSWEDCVDVVDMLVESGGSELDLDPEGKECFRNGLVEADLGHRLLAGAFTNEDGAPDEQTANDFLTLLEDCGSSDGTSPVVDGITESLLEGSSLTEDQARCLAQGVVDELGVDRMSELFSSGAFDDLTEDGQSEVTGALLQAAVACDVPLDAFG